MNPDFAINAKQYIDHNGEICPVCEHPHVGYTINYEHEDSLRNFTCYGCGATWRDTYKLTGFTDVVRKGGE